MYVNMDDYSQYPVGLGLQSESALYKTFYIALGQPWPDLAEKSNFGLVFSPTRGLVTELGPLTDLNFLTEFWEVSVEQL